MIVQEALMCTPSGIRNQPSIAVHDYQDDDLSPALMSRLAGWGWYGLAQDRAQWRSLGNSTQPAAWPLCLAALYKGIPFVGPLPVTLNLTLTLW
eukprot:350108-Chlamydomonas_euryale.AAC.3